MSNEELEKQVAALRQELETLRRAVDVPRTAGRRFSRSLVVLAALVVGAGALAFPGGRTFVANQPAVADDVNFNFDLLDSRISTLTSNIDSLKAAVEAKVGLTTGAGSREVRVQAGATSNTTVAAGKALFVSGNLSSGNQNSGGVEVRRDDLSSGVGIGFDTIYATGSQANQDLQLKARGNGSVDVLSTLAGLGTDTLGRPQSAMCIGTYDCGTVTDSCASAHCPQGKVATSAVFPTTCGGATNHQLTCCRLMLVPALDGGCP